MYVQGYVQYMYLTVFLSTLFCRLLYTGRVVFNNSVLLDNKASVILLTPSGQLITVSVPFHLLLRQVVSQ